MKKIIVMLMTAALVLPVSCTMDEPAGGQPATSQQGDIEITVADFVDADGAFGDTRSTISLVEGKPGQFAFSWAAGDEIGVFPNAGESSQQLMVTVGSDGKMGDKTLSGTTVGWKVDPEMSYAAYYPMTEEYELKSDAVIFDYSGQVQSGNNSLAHLGAKDFLVAAPCEATQKSGSEYGQLKFKFSHVGAVVRIRHTITEGEAGGSYSAVNLQVADFKQVIPTQLNVDLFGGSTPAITSVAAAMSDTFTVEIENCPALAAGNNLDVWMMLPPMNLSEKNIYVIFKGDGCSDISYLITGRNIESGKSYAINNGAPIEEHDLDFVDLGLPTGTLWATMDIGASSPTEKGQYYAWGDTSVRSSFTQAECKYNAGTGKWSKYNNTDNFTILEYSDDIAVHSWGNNWRLPLLTEWTELLENCTVEKTSTQYYTVTGKNGNAIYLPIGGRAYENSVKDADNCWYWAKDKQQNTGTTCSNIQLTGSTINISRGGSTRWWGMSCRAVRTEKKDYLYVDLGLPSGTLWAVVNLGAVVDIMVDGSGLFTGEIYSWGCDNKSDDWKDYKWNQGTSTTISGTIIKYNTTDGKEVLDKEDDIVYQKYGGSWAIPTKEQWEELLEYCTCTILNGSSDWGCNGVVFTSKINGRIIRMARVLNAKPKNPSTSITVTSNTFGYWTATRDKNNESVAYIFMNNIENLISTPICTCDRCSNLPIRPVNNKNVDWSKLEKYKN